MKKLDIRVCYALLAVTAVFTPSFAVPVDPYYITDQGSYYSPECQNKTYLPHDCSPVHFYSCKNGRKTKMKCPDGLFFDRDTTTCTWPPHGTCQTYLSPDCDPNSVYLADREDPRSFYQCSNGVFYKFSCPKNLVFNTEHNICDWPQDVGDEDANNGGSNFDSKWSWPSNGNAQDSKNLWVPVVGARPHPDIIEEVPLAVTNPNYPSVSLNGQKKEQASSARKNNDATTSTDGTGPKHSDVASRTEAPLKRVPAGMVTERSSLPFLMEDSDVSVSVDTLTGAINIASNNSDVMVHFKPSKTVDETTADVTITKTLRGDMTVRTGISAPRDPGTNITLRLKDRKA